MPSKKVAQNGSNELRMFINENPTDYGYRDVKLSDTHPLSKIPGYATAYKRTTYVRQENPVFDPSL